MNLSGCSAESPVNGLEYEDYDRISLQKHSFGRPLSRKCYKLRRIVVLHILPILIFLLCTKCQRTPHIFLYDFRTKIFLNVEYRKYTILHKYGANFFLHNYKQLLNRFSTSC